MIAIDSPYIVACNCSRGPMLFNKHEQIMAYALFTYGEFAEDELCRIEKYLKPGMTVLDIGANIGTHATAFAKMVGSNGSVYAFEPHPCNFNILCGNIALRGTQKVYPVRAMVGSKDINHRMAFVDAEQSLNFGSLTAIDKDDDHGILTQEMTIDSIGFVACDFIKIDVEGFEINVLEGAEKTIEKFHPPILAECNELQEGGYDKYFEAIAPFFRKHVYEMYFQETRLYRPENFNKSTTVQAGHDRNIMAVHGRHPELTEGLERVF